MLDATTGLLKISSAQFSALKSLFFTINNVDYEFTADAQIWPVSHLRCRQLKGRVTDLRRPQRSLNGAIGGGSGDIFLIVSDIGTNSGSGLDVINGFTFLERFYSVYDTTNKRVGLANTQFTRATSNFNGS